MKHLIPRSAALLSFLFMASPLFAQSRWTAEMRGGVNVADDEFSGGELKTRSGLELGVRVRTTPNLFVYGAWDWQNRAAKTPRFGARADVEEAGVTFGVGYVGSLGTRVRPWVRAGGLLSHVGLTTNPPRSRRTAEWRRSRRCRDGRATNVALTGLIPALVK